MKNKKEKYPNFNKKELAILEQLDGLFEAEHGGCDQSTCSMSVAMDHGYSVHAIDCFASSGAASDEFYELLEKLDRKKIDRASTIEANELCKELETADCPHCNAVVWDPQWVTSNGKVFCDSCANEFPANSEVKHG